MDIAIKVNLDIEISLRSQDLTEGLVLRILFVKGSLGDHRMLLCEAGRHDWLGVVIGPSDWSMRTSY